MNRYRTQSPDTSPEAERLLVDRYRSMTPADKIRIVRQLSRACQELALVGIRRRHPQASPDELRMRLAATRLDAEQLSALLLSRRVRVELSSSADSSAYLTAAENVILRKLD